MQTCTHEWGSINLNYTLNLPPSATWHIIPLSCWHMIIQILQTFVCWWYLLHSRLIIKHKGNPQISHLNCDKLTYLIDNFVFGVDHSGLSHILFFTSFLNWGVFFDPTWSKVPYNCNSLYIKKNNNGFCKCLTKFLEFFELFFIRKENYLIIQGILLLKQAHV